MQMEKRRMGADGPEVSLVGLGCNNFGMRIDDDASAAVVHAALEAGITHFDTAEMYGGGKSEEFLGRALGTRRNEVVIATKASPRPQGEEYREGSLDRRIHEACEGSLKRLGTDRIDLYYQHYPDSDAPLEEVLSALDSLVKSGKVLHVACSNYSGDLLGEATETARRLAVTPFCADQVEWSLLKREAESSVVPVARRLDISVVPYFPLASGMLTGKYHRGEDFPQQSRLASSSYFAGIASDENFRYVEELTRFAEERGHTILELAMAWLAAQDGVASVIAGATSPSQVDSNVSAAAAWKMTSADLAALPART
jgi:aryl-alcohol dehydrogenase-like predicted oxidoreductase